MQIPSIYGSSINVRMVDGGHSMLQDKHGSYIKCSKTMVLFCFRHPLAAPPIQHSSKVCPD